MDAFIWDVDREIIGEGFIALRWYSLLFALGFIAGYNIMRRMFLAEGKSEKLLDSLLMHVIFGTVIGARLGHCLFYEPMTYLRDPIRILKVWEGGLASHGGFLGVIIALILFCYRYRDIKFFWLADRVTIPAMLAASFIRIGNFFNSEIIGNPTDLPWAVIFAKVDHIPRHPAQLYEAICYFFTFVVLLWYYRAKDRKPMEGRIMGLAMIVAFICRFLVEFVKEEQVAFEQGMLLNMGQMLSIPFMLLGVFFVLGGQQKVKLFRLGLNTATEPGSGVKPHKKKGHRR